MAKLIKCDRCGTILTEEEMYDKEYPDAPSTVVVRTKSGQDVDGRMVKYPNDLRYDLCQNCTNSLMDFLKK